VSIRAKIRVPYRMIENAVKFCTPRWMFGLVNASHARSLVHSTERSRNFGVSSSSGYSKLFCRIFACLNHIFLLQRSFVDKGMKNESYGNDYWCIPLLRPIDRVIQRGIPCRRRSKNLFYKFKGVRSSSRYVVFLGKNVYLWRRVNPNNSDDSRSSCQEGLLYNHASSKNFY